MAIEGPVRKLLEEIKYKQKLPPREKARVIKNELAARGLGNSGALVEAVASTYVQVVEGVLEEFTDTVIAKASAVGISDDDKLRRVVADAHQNIFDFGRGALLEEFGGAGDYANMAMGLLDSKRGPVWEHLERKLELRRLDETKTIIEKEREQKFGILLSPGQAARDFAAWAAEAKKWGNPIAVLFLDIDRFKALNERLTHTKVDQTLLPQAQKLLAKMVQGRGEGYRHGGEEFVLIIPNLDACEAEAFAEKIRVTVEQHRFDVDGRPEAVTVSVGVAMWPDSGSSYDEVLASANRAEAEAKKTRNVVRVASK